ncbi:MAG: hypothetical protein LQ344_006945 [Seirophora lacunosa]|nr:MAG: hypothetical protein LQ344_006945 [Seirophora lacunosa]
MLYFQTVAVLALLVSSSYSLSSKAQKPLKEEGPSPFTQEFDEYVIDLLDHWHVPGLSIAVVDGRETFSKGYGISSFPSTPVTPSTLFYTGSTTKAFTAAALALLIDERSNSTSPLSWTTPLSTLIPSDFVLPDEYATLHATLEDAASHRTGMPRHDGSYGGPNFHLRNVVRNLRNLPMTAEIRTRFQYCNMMYMTLSHVIETLTGSWLGDVLWERIWEPLRMTRTIFSLSQAQEASKAGVAHLAEGYMWNNLTQKYVQTPWMDIRLVSGAGNIISNVDDYAKWLHFLINQSAPLSKAGHMSLRHARTICDDNPIPGILSPSTYALGWSVENYRGEPLISHDGGTPGFGALIGYLPQRGYGVAMMANTYGRSNIVQNILFYHLLDDLLGIPEHERGDVAAAFGNHILGPRRKQLEDPIKALYPTAPTGSNAIPLSLPLERYAGVYFNDGYRNLTITPPSPPDDPSSASSSSSTRLRIQPSHHALHSVIDRTWAFRFVFRHVSGDFFLVEGFPDELSDEEVDLRDPLSVLLLKAEFRLGEDGAVEALGLVLEPEMRGEKIWFRRVDGWV